MGCCGAKRVNVDYEVTFKDGTTTVVGSLPEARVLMGQDATKGRPAPTVRAIARKTL